MGKYSVEKLKIEADAVSYFKQENWNPHLMGPGRFCDLLAINGTTNAIVEIKSLKESNPKKGYDDTKNWIEGMPIGFGERRQRLIDIVNDSSISEINGKKTLLKKYLVAIGCQLFRYLFEFEGVFEEYKKRVPCLQKELRKEAYLIVPAEESHIKALELALGFAQREHIINLPLKIKESNNLIVQRIDFCDHYC